MVPFLVSSSIDDSSFFIRNFMSISNSNSGGNNNFLSSYQPFRNFVSSVTRWIIPTRKRIRGISPGGSRSEAVNNLNNLNKENLNDKNKTDQQ